MLQTWAQDGTPMLRLGDRIGKFLGQVSVGWNNTGSTQSGSFTDGRLTAYPNARPFFFLTGGSFNPRQGGLQVTISGNTVSWAYPLSSANQYTRPNATFVYGFF